MATDCIFCKIIAGELPCSPVYEDNDVLAFLDVAPIMPGHVLVIPREHHDPITATPDDDLARCIAIVKKLVAAQQEALGTDGASINQSNGTCAGQVVPHLHFHVIPRYDAVPFTWESGSYESNDEMSRIARELRSVMLK